MESLPDKYLELVKLVNGEKVKTREERLKEALEYLENKIDAVEAQYFKSIKLLRQYQKEQAERIKQAEKRAFNKAQRGFLKRLIDGRVEKIIFRGDKNYTTKTRYKDGYTLTDRLTLVSSQGKGIVSQILCKAQTNNFGIFILLDDNLVFEKDYSYFEDLSDYLENISAFDDGGKYFLSIRKLQFKRNVRVDVTTTSSTVFDNILVKYVIRDDIPRVGAD